MKILFLMVIYILIIFTALGLKNYGYISANVAAAMISTAIAFLLIGWLIGGVMAPTYSHNIRIEVLEEKNKASEGVDVGIRSISKDRVSIDLMGKEISGNWRRRSDSISWGHAIDNRLNVEIPAYSSAEITFIMNKWAGIVKVIADEKENVLDLYSADESSYIFKIEKLPFSAVFPKLIPVLLVLLVSLVVIGLLSWRIFVVAPRKGYDIIAFFKGKPTLLLRTVIVVLAFLVMLSVAGDLSLWADDLATIQFVAEGQSLHSIVEKLRMEAYYNPPLFYIIAYLWLRIVPYGTVYLKLLNILFVCCGICLCGTAAKKIAGDRAAVSATAFAASSLFLVRYAALTFRCYGLLFMLSPILLIAYQNRLEKPQSVRLHIYYGITMTLMAYTNYISLLIIAAIGLHDCWLFIKKRIQWNFIGAYIGGGLLFLPCLLRSSFINIVKEESNFWPSVPDLSTLKNTIDIIFSGEGFLKIFFTVAVILSVSICRSLTNTQFDCKDFSDTGSWSAAVTWVIFVIGFSYVFSRYISPMSSMFVQRYFVSVLAPVVILAALGIEGILIVLQNEKSENFAQLISIVLIVCCFCKALSGQIIELNRFAGTINQPYEQAIDWIYSRRDAHGKDTLVVFTGYSGGFYYYGTHGGTRSNLNFGSLNEDNWQQYKIVFVSPMHGEISEKCKSILDSHFEQTESVPEWNLTVFMRKEDINI